VREEEERQVIGVSGEEEHSVIGVRVKVGVMVST